MEWSWRSAALLCAACVASAHLVAQQRFTSTTSLLTIDVSALDDKGRPVIDLRPEDFVVTLNKETTSVRTMVFLATRNSNSLIRDRASDSNNATAASLAGGNLAEPDPKLLVILVDDLSIFPTDSKGLFVAAERFVDAVPVRDWVGLTSTSGRLMVNPALDRGLLMTQLKRAFGWMNDPRRENNVFVGLMDALDAQGSQAALRNLVETSCQLSPNLVSSLNLGELLNRYPCAREVSIVAEHTATFARVAARNQLDAYTSVINAMASAPGVKQLVILTGGVAVRPADSREFIPVAEAAAAAGVQISMLAEEPDDNPINAPRALAKDQRRMLQQAQAMTELAGGQFFRVIGQADRFYERVLTSASALYRIGIDFPTTAPSDGQYKLEVTVNRPGVRVLASRYAVPPPPTVTLTPAERMHRAIRTGELAYAVPVQMSAEIVPPRDGSPTAIRVRVNVAGDSPGPVLGLFGMVGPDQRLQSGRRDLVRSTDGKTFYADLLVPVAAGSYDLRFAVSDASGAIGATRQKVVVQ